MSRIACYGGAFDPPHLAHLFTVTYLLGRADVDRVWLVPTADHVFGKRMAPFAARVEMLRAALDAAGLAARVEVCAVEAERGGPSRTIDTLSLLSARHPEHAFCWVIGADNLTESHRWHRFDDLTARWPLIVLGRPGHEASLAARIDAPWCRPGPTLPDISSTALRAALRGVGDPEALRWLPDAIRERAVALYPPEPAAATVPEPVWILGAGRAGRALAGGLRVAGIDARLWNRSGGPGLDATDAPPIDALTHAPLWILAVSDDALAPFAAELAAALPGDCGATALHTAGRLGAEALAPLAARGLRTGSLHPLQSLRGDGEALRGAFCAVEGDAAAIAEAVARAVGGRPVRLPAGQKAAYHAAAVLSANFATTLGAGGVALLEALGLDEPTARAMLAPLLRGTVEHFAAAPAADALTGPFARGDLDTVAAHVEAIARHAPEWLPVYRALGRATARMLGWPAARRARLDTILEEDPGATR